MGRFYKRLYIYYCCADKEVRFKNLLPMHQIEKDHLDITNGVFRINNLKKAYFEFGFSFVESNARTIFATDHPQLERVSFRNAHAWDILPFICGSTKLTRLRVESLVTAAEGIDLWSWNCQRSKLDRAQKVTILCRWKSFPGYEMGSQQYGL